MLVILYSFRFAIVDRVNGLRNQRMKFMRLEKARGFKTAQLVFKFPLDYGIYRAKHRHNHNNISSMYADRVVRRFAQSWEPPSFDTEKFVDTLEVWSDYHVNCALRSFRIEIYFCGSILRQRECLMFKQRKFKCGRLFYPFLYPGYLFAQSLNAESQLNLMKQIDVIRKFLKNRNPFRGYGITCG